MKENSKDKNWGDQINKAKAVIKLQNLVIDKLSEDDVRKMAHTLQVSHIELEMQNNELRKIQKALEEETLKYTNLYDFAPVGYLTFSLDSNILELNLKGSEIIGRDRKFLIGTNFYQFILKEDRDVFYNHLYHIFKKKEAHKCELRLKKL